LAIADPRYQQFWTDRPAAPLLSFSLRLGDERKRRPARRQRGCSSMRVRRFTIRRRRPTRWCRKSSCRSWCDNRTTAACSVPIGNGSPRPPRARRRSRDGAPLAFTRVTPAESPQARAGRGGHRANRAGRQRRRLLKAPRVGGARRFQSAPRSAAHCPCQKDLARSSWTRRSIAACAADTGSCAHRTAAPAATSATLPELSRS